jgi:multiple sugar transport system permease protein
MTSASMPDLVTNNRRMRQRRRLSMEHSSFLFSILLILPSALLIGSIVVVPFFHVLLISLQSIEVGSLSGRFVGLANYKWAFSSSELHQAVIKSLVWTFGTVGLQIVLGVAFALLLNQRLLWRGLLRALTLFPYMVPTIVAVLVWRYLMHDLVGPINHALTSLGMIDQPLLWLDSPRWAMLSVIIIAAWKHFPFVVVIVLAMLQTIPREQYEAAAIDGATDLQQFRYITLPAILPAIAIAAFVRLLYEINGFDIIYLLTGGGPVNATKTLPILVYTKAFSDFQLGRAAAAASIAFLLLTAFLLLSIIGRFFRSFREKNQ